MSYANIERLSVVWICAFFVAIFLHFAFWMQFYFHKMSVASRQGDVFFPTVMLTFTQEGAQSDLDEEFHSDFLDFGKDSQEMLELVAYEDGSKEIQSFEEQEFISNRSDFIVQEFQKKASLPEEKSEVGEESKVEELSITQKNQRNKGHTETAQLSTFGKHNSTRMYDNTLLAQWFAKLQAQLERQKKYLMRKRIRHVNGIVQLEFKVQEQGEVVFYRIAQSSGNNELDHLAIVALQRASFPPPPYSNINEKIRVSLIFN
ncbi:energy transducer TonB [Bartonella ancashensis]|uniref:Ferric siderophore transport system, periplasmic binding protein TonB n=1 Tax=Bartonella ancashensis TaxID=1318743 RepID=A0A0M5L1B4_9HYPH|nr:energy transducer TonB [Bartonella ancashensis]ALE04010.1 Ferric siderophore transport system, periplasmic binding protein TonB [Bartonella ancashensis]